MKQLLEFSSTDGVIGLARAAVDEFGAHSVGLDWDDRFWLLARLAQSDPHLAHDYSFYLDQLLPASYPWSIVDFHHHAMFGQDSYLWDPTRRAGPHVWSTVFNPGEPLDRFSVEDSLDGDIEPFVLRVSLDQHESIEAGEVQGSLSQLATDVPGIRIEVEVAPIPELTTTGTTMALAGGDRVFNTTRPGSGTVGAVVEDRASGTALVATAGHVSERGDLVDVSASHLSAGTVSGRCQASEYGTQSNTSTYAQFSAAPEVDFALVEPTSGVSPRSEVDGVGRINSILPMANVPSGSMALSRGRSGLRQLRIGGLQIATTLRHNNSQYLYRNLFELRDLSRLWALWGLIRRPARPGDSGGWVVRDGPGGPDWVGVVVGGDASVGYACFAEGVASRFNVGVI